MCDQTEADDLAIQSEGACSYEPMHFLFEIQLITNEIVGRTTAENSVDFSRKVKTQHVRRYLVNYYQKHAVLPVGRLYLGMTRPLNLEIGMVNFDAIRRKIRADSEQRKWMNFEKPQAVEDSPDMSLDSDVGTGVKE